jgi:hypothetical protein
MVRLAKLLHPAAFTVFLSSCAFDVVDVKYSRAELIAQLEHQSAFMLEDELRINRATCWYSRTLKKNTRWEPVGKIAQGYVYKSRDQILTLECSNVFEAYLVVADSQLVGFYLPVESGFVAVPNPIPLPTTQTQ